jgi:DNA invertase Pin-like site-specific DNA recombinase
MKRFSFDDDDDDGGKKGQRPVRVVLYASAPITGYDLEQAQFSAESQMEELREWIETALKGKEVEIVEELLDLHGPRHGRPSLVTLRDHARAGAFDIVAVTGLERLGRRLSEFVQVANDLLEANVHVISRCEGCILDGKELREAIPILNRLLRRFGEAA